MMDVKAINISGRLALLSDGTTVPITNIFDAWGDETENDQEAASFVCGEGRLWFSDHVENFDQVTVQ